MSQRCAVVIQARSNSTRMPNKILLPFYDDKSILELQIERLLYKLNRNELIVATSTNEADKKIVALCNKLNVKSFCGSEENVLDRFIGCSIQYNLDSIVRVCSDNVFIDTERVKKLINLSEEETFGYDYVSYSVNGKPGIKTHFGFWSEWVRTKALEKVATSTKNKLYIEHVTNFIYTNKDHYNCLFYDVLYDNQLNIRLTTDTPEDFIFQKEFFEKLIKKYGFNFTTTNIFGEVKENPEYQTIMNQQIVENEK